MSYDKKCQYCGAFVSIVNNTMYVKDNLYCCRDCYDKRDEKCCGNCRYFHNEDVEGTGECKNGCSSMWGIVNVGRLCDDWQAKDDKVIAAKIARNMDLLIGTEQGQMIRVPVDSIRITHRTAKGVRVIKLYEDDYVVAIGKCEQES